MSVIPTAMVASALFNAKMAVKKAAEEAAKEALLQRVREQRAILVAEFETARQEYLVFLRTVIKDAIEDTDSFHWKLNNKDGSMVRIVELGCYKCIHKEYYVGRELVEETTPKMLQWTYNGPTHSFKATDFFLCDSVHKYARILHDCDTFTVIREELTAQGYEVSCGWEEGTFYLNIAHPV